MFFFVFLSFNNVNALEAGTKMFIVGLTDDAVTEYHCTDAFNISSCTYDSLFSVTSQEANPIDISFNNDGTKMFILGLSGKDVNEYHCTNAFNISSCSYDSVFSVSSQEDSPRGLTFNN